MTKQTPRKTRGLTGAELVEARAALRAKLVVAGVVTVHFVDEAANDGGFWASQAVLSKRGGAVEADRSLNALATQVLSALVDEGVPGWAAVDGGRSQIDWAVDVDAMDHRHYDNVKFERQRVLGSPAPADASTIHADNASAAVLLALGGVAPTERSRIQYLRDGLKVLVDRTRSDHARFLTDAQREILIEGIAGTRTYRGHEQEWVSEVVWNGYHGYEHASDTELVQKLAPESLDDVVEGICGPLHITGGSDQEQSKRHSLIEVFSIPQGREALEAVAEVRGDEMLQSLPGSDEYEREVVGQEAPSMTVPAMTARNRSASMQAPSIGESMPMVVKAVPGKPYGKTPRVCLQIESGYRAGERLEQHWLSRSEAETWARDNGYTVLGADTPTSTVLLVNLFETFSDFQFEDREISGAELVDGHGGWLRKHKATVASKV